MRMCLKIYAHVNVLKGSFSTRTFEKGSYFHLCTTKCIISFINVQNDERIPMLLCHAYLLHSSPLYNIIVLNNSLGCVMKPLITFVHI